jgi:hypothetical protein
MSWYYYIPLWSVLVALIGWLLTRLDKKVSRYKRLADTDKERLFLTVNEQSRERNLTFVDYHHSKRYKAPYKRSKDRMAADVLKDFSQVDCIAVVLDTSQGLVKLPAWPRYVDRSLSPAKDPEGKECYKLEIKWNPIKAHRPLWIRSGFIIYRQHIMDYLEGLNDIYMQGGDAINTEYTMTIYNDAKAE